MDDAPRSSSLTQKAIAAVVLVVLVILALPFLLDLVELVAGLFHIVLHRDGWPLNISDHLIVAWPVAQKGSLSIHF